MRVRHCPHCREDFRPDIVRCSDCGGLLEDRDDECDVREEAAPATPPSDADDSLEGFAPIHASRDLDELPPLADRLMAAGIDCRIREQRRDLSVVGYRLLVRAEQQAAAAAALEPLLRPHVETDFDPTRGYARCPACDCGLEPHAAECPECGLPLAAEMNACPKCGAAVDAAAERCAECGANLGESV